MPKWSVQATALSKDGETQQPLKVGMESQTNPADGLTPGTPVIFEHLELGVIARDGGGAQLWYRAHGLRSLSPANGQAKTTAAAASASSGKSDDS